MTDAKAAKDPAELKTRILADPNTALIAERLGVPLEEYVAGVIHFAMNPAEKPELVVVTDEVAQEHFGLKLPKEAEIIQKFNAEVEGATIAEKTDYQGPKAVLVKMESEASGEPTTAEDPKLKEELKKQLRGKTGGNA